MRQTNNLPNVGESPISVEYITAAQAAVEE